MLHSDILGKSHRRSLLSILIIISLFISSFIVPRIAFAADITDDGFHDSSTEYGPQDGIEVESLRTPCSKQYALPDGTLLYVGSTDRIHWKNEDGIYQEINNDLIPTDYTTETGNYSFTNTSSDLKYFFSDNSEDSYYPVRIEYQDTIVALKADQEDYLKIPLESAVLPGPLHSSIDPQRTIVYETSNNWNIVYVSNASDLKEHLVLSDRADQCTFKFQYYLAGLTPAQDEESIYFKNESGDPIFKIKGLTAFDNLSGYTEEVKAKLLDYNDNTATIEITVSPDWLWAAEREYPIAIDPMTMVCGEYVTYDSYISSLDPDVNFYVNDYLRMGKDTDFGIRRSAIQFELPNIAASAVTSACINIRLYSSEGSLDTLYATPIKNHWTSSSITWNNQPSYDLGDLSMHAVPDTWHDNDNWYTWPCTSVTKQWLNGSRNNYGVMIFDTNESSTAHWSTFYSSDYGAPNRPELMIYYNDNNTTQYMRYFIVTPLSSTDEQAATQIVGKCSAMGYSSAKVYYPTATTIYNDMPSNVINILHGHGTDDHIVMRDSSNKDIDYLYCTSQPGKTSIYNYSSGSLSNNKLDIFIACHSNQMALRSWNKGAVCTLGFMNNVAGGEDFVNYLMYYMQNGNSFTEALPLASSAYHDSNGCCGSSCPAHNYHYIYYGTNIYLQ